MKFFVALLMCLMLSGCSRCWDEVCTLSCEQAGTCAPDVVLGDVTEDDEAVEVGDITVEDAEELVPSDVEVSLDDADTVPTVEEDVEN